MGKSHGIPVCEYVKKCWIPCRRVENKRVKKKQRFANLETSELDILLVCSVTKKQSTTLHSQFQFTKVHVSWWKKCSLQENARFEYQNFN